MEVAGYHDHAESCENERTARPKLACRVLATAASEGSKSLSSIAPRRVPYYSSSYCTLTRLTVTEHRSGLRNWVRIRRFIACTAHDRALPCTLLCTWTCALRDTVCRAEIGCEELHLQYITQYDTQNGREERRLCCCLLKYEIALCLRCG